MADIDSAARVRSENHSDFKALVAGKDVAGTPDVNAVLAVQGVPGGAPITATIEIDANGLPFGYVRAASQVEALAVASNADVETASIEFTTAGFITGVSFSASGRAKFDLTEGATYPGTPLANAMPQQFLPAGGANDQFRPVIPIPVAAGTIVYLRGLNRENQLAQDLAGMIEGYMEAP